MTHAAGTVTGATHVANGALCVADRAIGGNGLSLSPLYRIVNMQEDGLVNCDSLSILLE